MSNTQEFITGDIWKTANKKMPEKGKEAAIAYVTSSELKLSKGDTLICNASDYAIKNGQTDAKVLKYYFDKGINIYSNKFIHCKILLTNKTIIVGSANLSFSSANKLTEAAIISHDKAMISGGKSYILDIIEDSAVTKYLKCTDLKLLKIPVIRRPYNPTGTSKTRKKEFGYSYWLICTQGVNEEDNNHILTVKKNLSKQYNLKFEKIGDFSWRGKDQFSITAKKGDQFLNIYTKDSKKIIVFMFAAILKIEPEGNMKRIYYDQSSDKENMSWTKFTAKLKSLSLDRNILKNRTRKLSKNDAEEIMHEIF